MGAWGPDTFDNDTACDWASELEDVDDLSVVKAALKAALETDDDDDDDDDDDEDGGDEDGGDEEEGIDADVACEALAACEVLARLRGAYGARNSYTEPVDNWVKAHPKAPSPALLKLAHQAIDRVVQPGSELRELWEEAGLAEWLKAVEGLRSRLK